MLPLPVLDYDKESADVTDEGAFQIDVVTRTINTPKSFDSKFGKGCMAVQGDDVAEIVWFNIPRYIDSTDLNDPDMKIIIQWQGALAPDGKTQLSGVREDYYTDVTYNKGNILFGWPLDKEITKYPGTVKFAVRFYKTEDYQDQVTGDWKKRLTYSFSTLTSSFVVQPSLDFDLIDGGYDLEDHRIQQQIINRFVNSYPVQDDELNPATAPVLKRDIVASDETIMDLDQFDANDVSTHFRARAIGDGLVSYAWHCDRDGNEINKTVDSTISYILVEESTIEGEKVYFKHVPAKDGVPEHYEVIMVAVGTPIADLGYAVYEANSTLCPDHTGIYQVEAVNRKGKSYASTFGNKCIIPGPSEPIVDEDYLKEVMHYILDAKTEDTIEETEIEAYNTTKLAVVASANKEDGDKAVISYEWYKDDTFLPDTNDKELSVSEAGNYKVKVISQRNGDTISKESGIYRVTKLPTAVVFNTPATTSFYSGQTISLTFNAAASTDNDAIQYQWYRMTLADSELDNPVIGDDDVAIEGATGSSYKAAVNDNFVYCKATAKLNGTAITTNSAIFKIYDR